VEAYDTGYWTVFRDAEELARAEISDQPHLGRPTRRRTPSVSIRIIA
jgi:hypothetical protein